MSYEPPPLADMNRRRPPSAPPAELFWKLDVCGDCWPVCGQGCFAAELMPGCQRFVFKALRRVPMRMIRGGHMTVGCDHVLCADKRIHCRDICQSDLQAAAAELAEIEGGFGAVSLTIFAVDRIVERIKIRIPK